jgi:two-component system, chemotaxis family, chemotaxis protein CheY
MKSLVVEDDLTSRLLLQGYLKVYGATDVAGKGQEAVEAMRLALEANEPYNLICLDIMMPEMDGQETLKEIRRIEAKKGVARADRARIVMTTALSNKTNVIEASQHQCDCYLIKPYSREKLLQELRILKMNRPLGIWEAF